MHCSRRILLRRGLEFHLYTINKSAHTKKILETYLMILVYTLKLNGARSHLFLSFSSTRVYEFLCCLSEINGSNIFGDFFFFFFIALFSQNNPWQLLDDEVRLTARNTYTNGTVVECSSLIQKTGFQSLIESYHRLKTKVLDPSLLNAQYYRVLKGKWRNPRKEVTPSSTPRCSSNWKGSLCIAFGSPTGTIG